MGLKLQKEREAREPNCAAAIAKFAKKVLPEFRVIDQRV